jgi:hypothetical protein
MEGPRSEIPGGNYPTVSVNNSQACRLKKRPVRKMTEGCSAVNEVDGVRRSALEMYEVGPGRRGRCDVNCQGRYSCPCL